jgi:PBSX family phage terminase large subunit
MLLSRLSLTGASLFASTNPDSPYHWIKTDFMDRRNELDIKVFSFDIHDNPSLTEKYIKDLSAEYQGLWFKRYIEGKWVLADGAVYDFFDEEIHVIEHAPGVADFYIVGVDYGTTNPCTFTLIGFNGGTYPNMWLEKEYYYSSKEHLRQKSDYEYVKDLEKFIEGKNVKAIYMDPSAASMKQEMMRQSLLAPSEAKNDVLPGIRYVSQLLTNGTFKICCNCTETLKEFTNYLWDSRATKKGKDQPIKQSDHCLDSIRYAMFSHFYDMSTTTAMTERDCKRFESLYLYNR